MAKLISKDARDKTRGLVYSSPEQPCLRKGHRRGRGYGWDDAVTLAVLILTVSELTLALCFAQGREGRHEKVHSGLANWNHVHLGQVLIGVASRRQSAKLHPWRLPH
jgi:hypothetical protein